MWRIKGGILEGSMDGTLGGFSRVVFSYLLGFERHLVCLILWMSMNTMVFIFDQTRIQVSGMLAGTTSSGNCPRMNPLSPNPCQHQWKGYWCVRLFCLCMAILAGWMNRNSQMRVLSTGQLCMLTHTHCLSRSMAVLNCLQLFVLASF